MRVEVIRHTPTPPPIKEVVITLTGEEAEALKSHLARDTAFPPVAVINLLRKLNEGLLP